MNVVIAFIVLLLLALATAIIWAYRHGYHYFCELIFPSIRPPARSVATRTPADNPSADSVLFRHNNFRGKTERHSVQRRPDSQDKEKEGDINIDLVLNFHEGIFGVETSIEYERLERTVEGAPLEMSKRVVGVFVPPAVTQGTRLRISGEGDDTLADGLSGDLYIHLSIPYEYNGMRRNNNNNDIVSTLMLTTEQVEQGGEFLIETAYGEEMIVVPRGVCRREKIQLVERGVPVLGYPQKIGRHTVIIDF